jgi:cytochrome c oxidase assembly protein subunit 11
MLSRALCGAALRSVPSRPLFSRTFNSNRVGLRRFSTSPRPSQNADEKNQRTAYYMGAVVVFVFGLTYAAVPLYKVFCQMTGFGGTTQVAEESKLKHITPIENGRILRVYFTANVHSAMPWQFRPTQKEVRLVPGETALAFYTVKNTADHAITGVATYNVHPPKAGLYFNKIQCFCFEEQRLGAKEEIDMPVFFFIDPEFANDPAMDNVTNITLSYTFFKTGDEAPDTEKDKVETKIETKPTNKVEKAK